MKRRDAVKIIGVAGGLAAGGCVQKSAERVYPYLNQPEEIVPGIPTWYATTCRECPAGCGMRVKTLEGRPVKLEGNPDHPINKGALCARGQASIQGLYHPGRFRGPMARRNGKLAPISWDEALNTVSQAISSIREKQKTDKISMITSAMTGSMGELVDLWLQELGAPPKIIYEAFSNDALRRASARAVYSPEIPMMEIRIAEFLLGFGPDFLETGPSPVEYAGEFATVRERWGDGRARFIAFDSRLSMTAANADEWVPIRPGSEALLALAVLHVISSVLSNPVHDELKDFSPYAVSEIAGVSAGRIQSIARNLISIRPNLVTAGQTCRNGSTLWTTVFKINELTGNLNGAVHFGAGFGADWAFYEDMKKLVEKMAGKEIELLFINGANPVYSLPAGAKFAEAAEKIPLIVSFSNIPDETTEIAHLILPIHHFLESWGDYSPRFGITGLIQPTRKPLYDTRGLDEIIIELTKRISGGKIADLAERVSNLTREGFWLTKMPQSAVGQNPDESGWVEVRKRGGVWGLEAPPPQSKVNIYLGSPKFAELAPREKLTLQAFPSALFYDGRGAASPWLNDCPDPMSKVAGEAWLELHPDTAKRIGVGQGSVARVKTAFGSGEWPVLVTESVHPGLAAIPTGTRNHQDGALASNVMALLPTEPDDSGCLQWTANAEIVPAGRTHDLASLQGSDVQHNRGLARDTEYVVYSRAKEEWKENNRRRLPPRKDMYPPPEHPDYHWGMVIDLDRCTGCSACVVACYAENNIPVVGHERLLMRREMAWMRIERYYEVRNGARTAFFLPMLCQHCGMAPCETVCPVFASYHTPEGLNAQVYNRCVGTRYCSNNCPYKVRRFNWFTYHWPEPLNIQLNPDVTVREKGVMEKCTFCVQRIMAAKIAAKREGRKVRDGDIVPACAQTCPTKAIVFGNLKDTNSRVSILSKSNRGYQIFEELNTKPAVIYLKRVTRKMNY